MGAAANADVHWIWSTQIDGMDGRLTQAAGNAHSATISGRAIGQTYWFIIIAGRTVDGEQEWSRWNGWVGLLVPDTLVPAESGDRAVLVALHNATGGPDWANNRNWLGDAPLDQWHGVTTDASGRVIELNLDETRMSGSIPAALGTLTELQALNFGHHPNGFVSYPTIDTCRINSNRLNELIGNIPAVLGDLTKLSGLLLTANRLTGPIPEELGRLSDLAGLELGQITTLRWLNLSSNQFTGQIPGELGNLDNLVLLYLAGNQLTGCVPTGLQDVRINDFRALGLPFC